MHQAPVYLGYVPTPQGRPTLFFSSGFLVQSNPDAAQCGWYRYTHPVQLAANAAPSMVGSIAASEIAPAAMTMVMRSVRDLADRQQAASTAVDPQDVYVLFDVEQEDYYQPSPVYTFPGPIHRVGSPGFDARFGEHYANATVGAFDATGVPLNARRLAPSAGLLRFG